MATLRRQVALPVAPAAGWAAVTDIGRAHSRRARAFVTDMAVEADGSARRVTFANGLVAREWIVTLDRGCRRLACACVGGAAGHLP